LAGTSGLVELIVEDRIVPMSMTTGEPPIEPGDLPIAGGRQAEAGLGAPSLLATKLHIPRPQRSMVPRERLLAQLDDACTHPLTLIAAPPGFGKTALLSDWLSRGVAPRAAWVSLDPGDNDPARFWAYVMAALETLRPGVGASTLALLNSPEFGSLETILTALINTMSTGARVCTLVLDDYHHIENPLIDKALAFLINHAPEQLRLIVSTRADPALPLAGWRARGTLAEIRAADLRFTPEETAHFLGDNTGLTLSREELTAIESRTEGWIAGLQLAAMALRGQRAERVPGFVSAATSSNRYVVDYFVEEVLQVQQPEDRAFLLQTAILERLSAQLCNQVTGLTDGQAVLERLERAGLFLVHLDVENRWYRYHHLFADVLRKLLEQAEPELVPELHRRASAWFAGAGLVPEAIAHALVGMDYPQAAVLLESIGMETLGRGEVTTLSNWLASVPPDVLYARPRLCIYYACALMSAGRFESVEPLLEAADRVLVAIGDDPDANPMAGLMAAIRATLAVLTGDVSRIVEVTSRALDCLPEDPIGMTGIRSWIRGLAYLYASQRAPSDRSLSEAISASQAAGDPCMVAFETYAYGLLALERGSLEQAGAAYLRALASLAERGESEAPVAGLVHLGMGEMLRIRNDLSGAETHVSKGLQLARPLGNIAPRLQGYVSLAWIRQARGDGAGALAALDEAEGLARGPGQTITASAIRAHRARLQIVMGDLPAAEDWARQLTPANVDGLPSAERLLRGHVEVVAWAALRTAQGRPDEALPALQRLRAESDAGGWRRVQIDAIALQALAFQAGGDSRQAVVALHDALELAVPEGHVRPFIDLGPRMRRLLAEGTRQAAWRGRPVEAYAARLLSEFDRHLPQTPLTAVQYQGEDGYTTAHRTSSPSSTGLSEVTAPAEPLSDREVEVLRLLAAGLSNQDIANRLYLSVATVKTHAHHIYGKLGVPGRQRAAQRAGQLGLL